MGQTVLEMIGIKKSFSGIYALSGIDFSLELGEVHALLGENGAGKSTLIKVLGGIYQPDSGIIKVNGKEVKINGVPAARENGIGIIHQEIVLVPYLSVAQNLFLGREIRTKLGTLDFAEMNRRAEEMISSLGVNIKADTIVVTKQDGYYGIVAGERRWRAAKLAGLEEIPAIIREDDEQKNREIALIENIQREDLNPYEKALGIRNLMDKYGLTQEEVSKRIGKNIWKIQPWL